MQLSPALIIFVITIATSLLGLSTGNPKIIEHSLFDRNYTCAGASNGTVVCSGFVHADLMHLIFNMMTFYFFGFL